ncbi:MAG: L,D-transpeptidase, partial [Parasporobacterium sp.]|nr:L,D-transpeptidase [Parasporobacterium sp.]
EDEGYTCWWWVSWNGPYLFHSQVYNIGSMTSLQDASMGVNVSHGCVRLYIDNAKWLYDNIPSGTKVFVY